MGEDVTLCKVSKGPEGQHDCGAQNHQGRHEGFRLCHRQLLRLHRADTIFGVTFMVLAPESELVAQLTTDAQRAEVEAYLEATKKRTERERIADRKVSGVFSGSYAVNPFTGDAIPVWISDYVLAGYGTGAIMAVPAHDSRDYAFARHFNLPIVPLIEGADVSEESFDAKEGIVSNSPAAGKESLKGFSLNGLTVKEAIAATKKFVTENGLGRVKVNYRLRDAIFSRQADEVWGCLWVAIPRTFLLPSHGQGRHTSHHRQQWLSHTTHGRNFSRHI